MQLCREVTRVVKCRQAELKQRCLQYNYDIKCDLVACQCLKSFLNDQPFEKSDPKVSIYLERL